jgi:hypothetical protein
MFGIENVGESGLADGFSLLDGKILDSPLTIPVLIDPARPNGFPIATTVSPTFNPEEFTTGSGAI